VWVLLSLGYSLENLCLARTDAQTNYNIHLNYRCSVVLHVLHQVWCRDSLEADCRRTVVVGGVHARRYVSLDSHLAPQAPTVAGNYVAKFHHATRLDVSIVIEHSHVLQPRRCQLTMPYAQCSHKWICARLGAPHGYSSAISCGHLVQSHHAIGLFHVRAPSWMVQLLFGARGHAATWPVSYIVV
jgi:hypothetical protein